MQLAANVEHARAALDAGDSVSAMNREFHRLLAEVAGNRVLALLMQALDELLERVDERAPNAPAISRCALDDHQEVLDAVRAADPATAERLMAAHLRRLEARLREPQSEPVPALPRVLIHAAIPPLHSIESVPAPVTSAPHDRERSEQSNGYHR
jgi:DNA-binding FadR family transcriptional regulator